jgi:hypothetical protein
MQMHAVFPPAYCVLFDIAHESYISSMKGQARWSWRVPEFRDHCVLVGEGDYRLWSPRNKW